jgi:hypothetical protein
MSLFGLFRKKKEQLPVGEFKAPKWSFRVDPPTHQGGYHIHLYKLHQGKQRLTNICFTRIKNKIYTYEHAEGKSTVKFSIQDFKKNKMKKELDKIGLFKELRKSKQWTEQVPESAISILTF